MNNSIDKEVLKLFTEPPTDHLKIDEEVLIYFQTTKNDEANINGRIYLCTYNNGTIDVIHEYNEKDCIICSWYFSDDSINWIISRLQPRCVKSPQLIVYFKNKCHVETWIKNDTDDGFHRFNRGEYIGTYTMST